jgi:hypothetical protein
MRVIEGRRSIKLVDRLRMPATPRPDDADVDAAERASGCLDELPAALGSRDVRMYAYGLPATRPDVVDDRTSAFSLVK